MSSVLEGIPALLPTNVGPAFSSAYGQARQQGLQQQQVNQQGQQIAQQGRQIDFQQAQEVHAIVSRAAQLADTPQKWAQMNATFQRIEPNYDPSQFPFEARDALLAQLKDPYKDAQLGIDQQRLALDQQNANRPTYGTIGTTELGLPQYGWVDRTHQTVTPSGTGSQFDPTSAPASQPAAGPPPSDLQTALNAKAVTYQQAQGLPAPPGAPAGMPVPGAPPPSQPGSLYDRLTPGQKATVDAIIDGREPFPGSTALKVPYWQGLVQAANERSLQRGGSGFDATQWTARNATNKNFTSGPTSATITAGNTAIGHIDQLSQLVDKLPDTPFGGDLPFVGGAARAFAQNSVRGTPDGKTLAQWDVVRKAVSDEVTKFWRGSGGAESDVQAALGNLNTAKSKPELHAAITALVDLMGSKTTALQDQWHNGMGPEVPDFPVLTPDSQARIDAIRKRANPDPPAGGGGAFVWTPDGGLRPAQ